MRLSRHAVTFALVLALGLSGCIENMGDLKETLGVRAPTPDDPVYAAPLAKAQANASDVFVGAPVSFLSDGTRDPQRLPLDFDWDFADGHVAQGPYATHAFATAGEFAVKLRVTNLGGLTDDDTIVVRVSAADRAPSAAIRVVNEAGVASLRTSMNAPLAFDAIASDPEGASLSYEWDFGDGSTSHEAATSHAYAKPGLYDARLKVADRAGNAAIASARIAVDATWRASGAFEPTGPMQVDTPVFVAPSAQSLGITLSFPAGAGLNDLELVVLDANGDEVARTSEEPAAGGQGDAARELIVKEFGAPGEWTVRVLRERGLSVEWTVDISELV